MDKFVVSTVLFGLFHLSESTWSLWDPWTPCSVTCGDGVQTRERTCIDGYAKTCIGPSIMYNACNLGDCHPPSGRMITLGRLDAMFSNVTCGDGVQTRERTCVDGNQKTCIGPSIMYNACNLGDCHPPSESTWSLWDAWTPCSVTCGDGVQTKERTCVDGDPKTCIGPSIMYNACNLGECHPPSNVWSVWGEWSGCSKTCGGGEHVRRRDCLLGDVSECCVHTDPKGCEYEHYQTRECVNEDCHGHWSIWRAWSQCSESCGEGNQTRTRDCEPADNVCSGPSVQTRSCYTQCTPEANGIEESISCTYSNPCQNGGVCAHGDDHVTCFCHGDWRGNDCSSMCIRPDEQNVCNNKEGIFHMCNNCTKFVICSRGIPISMACVDGRIWTGDGCKLPTETKSMCIEW